MYFTIILYVCKGVGGNLWIIFYQSFGRFCSFTGLAFSEVVSLLAIAVSTMAPTMANRIFTGDIFWFSGIFASVLFASTWDSKVSRSRIYCFDTMSR